MNALERLGFGPDFAAAFEPYASDELIPARVAVEHHGFYSLLAAQGELGGVPSGRLKLDGDEPAVGDWVAVEKLLGERKALIRAVLPRRTTFSRKEPWKRTAEQVVAASVDVCSSSPGSAATSTCGGSSATRPPRGRAVPSRSSC